jgi:hypothetical protein
MNHSTPIRANLMILFMLDRVSKDLYIYGMKNKKLPADINRRAKSIVDMATGDQDTAPLADQEKNPAAVALGRLGGLKGGKARAESLTAKKRKEIAKKAAAARWKKGV